MISILSTIVLCLALLVAPVAIPLLLENVYHISNGLEQWRTGLLTWGYSDSTDVQSFNGSYTSLQYKVNIQSSYIPIIEANNTEYEDPPFPETTFQGQAQICALIVTVTSVTIGLYVILIIPSKEAYFGKYSVNPYINKGRVTSPRQVTIGGPYYLNRLFCGSTSHSDLWMTSEPFLLQLLYKKPEHNYAIIGPLGSGAFGSVSLVRHRGNKQLLAMKQISKSSMVRRDLARGCIPGDWARFASSKQCMMEQKCLYLCKGAASIVQLFEVVQTKMNIYFIMTYCSGGSLLNVMTGLVPELHALHYIKQLLNGVIFLHSKNIIHRDIKPTNILLQGNGSLMLADFGLSVIVNNAKDSQLLKRCGTPGYMAPEVIRDEPYSLAVDYFAIGVIFYEMIEGIYTFPGSSNEEIFHNTCNYLPEFTYTSCVAMHAIVKLLEKDAANRMTDDYVNHYLFTQENPTPTLFKPSDYLRDETDRRYFRPTEPSTEETAESLSLSLYSSLFQDF